MKNVWESTMSSTCDRLRRWRDCLIIPFKCWGMYKSLLLQNHKFQDTDFKPLPNINMGHRLFNNVETFSVKQMLFSCSVHRGPRKQVLMAGATIRWELLMVQLQKVSQHREALKHLEAFVKSSESEWDLYLVCFKVFHISINSLLL